jgi:integrase
MASIHVKPDGAFMRAQDVDFERSQLALRQQAVGSRAGKSLTPLKTRAARRTVSIPTSVRDELRELPATDDGRLFYETGGGLWVHQGITNAVQRAARRAGMRSVHAHLLRHTAVSLLIDSGANARAIQALVGHSDIKLTLGTYGHLFDTGGAALAASMERRRREHTDAGDP